MKILLVFGTRPEAIKMCPLALQLAKTKGVEVKVCVTGQHREMLDQVLNIFKVTPDFDLNLMKPNQTLEWLTSAILQGVGDVIRTFEPALVLVHGDTTTSFAASLAAFYQQVEVGHVEAGLRTGDILSPWPEEANRKLTATLTKLHFAPTQTAKDNLLSEGHAADNIYVTGNTVIDALLSTVKIIRKSPEKSAPELIELLSKIGDKKKILITGHRRENIGQSFQQICQALQEIAIANPQVHLIYPVHLNPKVSKPVHDYLGNIENIHLIKPLDYLSFITLMDNCDIILTDSGGIQEEAPSLNKPVLVLRNNTERPEAVAAGTVKLVGTEVKTIVDEVTKLLDSTTPFISVQNPYGDGQSCQRICEIITEHFGLNQ